LGDILVKTLQELRPILRAVFILRDIEGLSTEGTAEVLHLSHAATKARLWRARLQLRERLNKYFGKQTAFAQAQLVPLDRRTGRILGLVAECLNHSISQTCFIQVGQLPHASSTIRAMDHREHELKHA
jgi:hypothetical protein